ncbi:DUF300-domain-containing protein [Epithele typhae]|uniref:DUF300-domain-containing protein n=1 Tax=Epithele typhae TaxID=378194 RepID=UPI00200801D7|nr:DUF300-domain-containing protein [Epithele typhae]KAH9915457.1 DUF300-domain-containing protein [Epithele typhae]
MLMVPLYAVSSFISLFSLDAAFFIDVVRDIYEAFVIYCFFDLLIAYLGGERSLLILLHGRPPKYPVFPSNIFWPEVDVSDPYTFLFLKRGVIQYVQIKPLLALATVILKAAGKYNEGDFRAVSGYLYISIVYNVSICLALYCLAMFWMCVNDDLKPFRPVPKFLCVKGVLFFCFWQSIFISLLVAAGAIPRLGPYTDSEHISLALTDTLICLEMPFFAIAHMYAFATRDYEDPHVMYVARMPVLYAFRDAFGLKDVVEDVKLTLGGEGMDYREFEPSEGQIHQGSGRDRRIRAGLRYSQGGKRKYWLPQSTTATQPPGAFERRVNNAIGRVAGSSQTEEVYAPLLRSQEENAVHSAEDLRGGDEGFSLFATGIMEEGYELPFGEIDGADEELFAHSKQYLFGDYNYPCVDVSSEAARASMWIAEERILRDEHSAWFSPVGGARRPPGGYGAVGHTPHGAASSYFSRPHVVIDKEAERVPPSRAGDNPLRHTNMRSPPPHAARLAISRTSSASPQTPTTSPPSARSSPRTPALGASPRTPLPPDAVDLVVEDAHAGEAGMTRERRRGEPAVRGGAGLHRVYRRGYIAEDAAGEVEVEAGAEEAEAEEVFEVEAEVVEETVARAVTPPPHARVMVDVPEDNPWA